MRDPRKKCRGLRKDGQPCNAYRLETGDLCVFHDWDALTAAALGEARSRGGRHSPKRRDAFDLASLPVDLHDSASLLAFTEGLIRMQLAGSIPQRQCSQILRSLRMAERILAGGHGADLSRHHRLVGSFVEVATEVADSLDDRDVLERTNEISDIRAKREEFLSANRKFGHNQPKPARTPSPSHPSFRMPNFLG